MLLSATEDGDCLCCCSLGKTGVLSKDCHAEKLSALLAEEGDEDAPPLASGSLLALLAVEPAPRFNRGVDGRFLFSYLLGDLLVKGKMQEGDAVVVGSVAVAASLRRTTTFIFFAMVVLLVLLASAVLLPSLSQEAQQRSLSLV